MFPSSNARATPTSSQRWPRTSSCSYGQMSKRNQRVSSDVEVSKSLMFLKSSNMLLGTYPKFLTLIKGKSSTQKLPAGTKENH